MKRKNKIFIIAAIALSLLLALALPSFAASADEEEICAADTAQPAHDTIDTNREGFENSATDVEPMPNDTSDTEPSEENAPTEKTGEENVFSEIYEYFTYYAGDIFGALAFFVSLVLSLLYKNKLMPAISKSAGQIEKELKRLEATTEAGLNASSTKSEEAKSSITELSKSVERICSVTERALERVENLDALAREREKIKTVLSSQIDMLYDIFMASSIPHFQKENVGNKIAEMKEELAKDE